MDTGGGFYEFYFNLQQQQQMQQLQNQQQRNQTLGLYNSQVVSPSCNNDLFPMAFSQPVAAQLEKQRHEIDWFIGLQNERLGSVLQEQRKQQLAVLLKRLESKTLSLLRQKDEDIAKAAMKTMELEDCLRRVEMENQAWQRVANENEAMAIALNNALEQARENFSCFLTGAEDAESCCDILGDREEETRETRDDEEEKKKRTLCKCCNYRSSCVLFLPCRHLCSCKPCEAFLDSCPVCSSVKKASFEVFMF